MNVFDMVKGGVIGLIVGMILAGAGVWWAKDQQVKAVKVELQAAKDANATLEKAKELLKEEVAKMDQSCTARINSKDKTIRKLKEIDNLKPGEVSNATDNNTLGSNSGDPILDALAGMWEQSDNQDGVRQADNTGATGKTGLLPGTVQKGGE